MQLLNQEHDARSVSTDPLGCRLGLGRPWLDRLAALVWHAKEGRLCLELDSRLTDPGWLLGLSFTNAMANAIILGSDC